MAWWLNNLKNKKMKYAQSRLRKKILTLSAFLFLSVLVWLDRTYHFIPQPAVPVSQTQDVNEWDKYHKKTFIVTKAVDGDTIDINIPDGRYEHTRIRLLGVDTPETKKPDTPVMYFGPEASAFTKEKTLGRKVTVIMDARSNPRDKYGRLLAHIQLDDGGILNEELISNGFAYADPRFSQSFNKEYAQLEKQAMKSKAGLWKKVTPDQMPKWRQKK
ncbi:MAG: thermonuclease family protein [Planctomycetaceae bacterium]|nr:thermonuclease family protein [Planctomycetaceae bacterium]